MPSQGDASSQPRVTGNATVRAQRGPLVGAQATPPLAASPPRPQLPVHNHRPSRAFVPPMSTHPPGQGPALPSPNPAPTQPIDADGRARGCRLPTSIQVSVGVANKDLGGVIPSWVEATPTPRSPPTGEAREVEGRLSDAHISGTDFPFRPWHRYYDWNYHVLPDPRYRNLLSTANVAEANSDLECEWDTTFLPPWAWGQRGQRIWVLGRWIYDCGHPTSAGYRTEIHPPKAVATFRSEAVRFFGNQGPTRATVATIYIGRNDSYFSSHINDQDYSINVPLPPRPNRTATPRVLVRTMTALPPPVNPVVSPVPSASAPQLLNVLVPLKGLSPEPDEYGLIVSAGWSDADGSETKQILKRRVTIDKIFMDANLDPLLRDEWYVYVCVNGRWKTFESLSGSDRTLSYRVDLDLHPTDKITISLCGFEADSVHDLMGASSGVTRSITSARSSTADATDAASSIRNAFLKGLTAGFPDENDSISRLFVQHSASDTGTFMVRPSARDYRLRYTIT
jgi:hypothetical protein